MSEASIEVQKRDGGAAGPRLLLAILVGVGWVMGLAGCRARPMPEPAGLAAGALAEAAHQTRAAHVRAIHAGEEEPSAEIPARYWAEEIRRLRPRRVYTHRVNLVVVQRVSHGVEQGKYIYVPESSYLPMSGIDGFEFTPNPQRGNRYDLGNGVFDFKRTRGD